MGAGSINDHHGGGCCGGDWGKPRNIINGGGGAGCEAEPET